MKAISVILVAVILMSAASSSILFYDDFADVSGWTLHS
jgi:hypothetical protein